MNRSVDVLAAVVSKVSSCVLLFLIDPLLKMKQVFQKLLKVSFKIQIFREGMWQTLEVLNISLKNGP